MLLKPHQSRHPPPTPATPNSAGMHVIRDLLARRSVSLPLSRRLSSDSARSWLVAGLPTAAAEPATSVVAAAAVDPLNLSQDTPSEDSVDPNASPVADRDSRAPLQRSYAFQTWSRRRRPKTREVWVCDNCGVSMGQWWGQCRACGGANTFKRFGGAETEAEPAVPESGRWLPPGAGGAEPESLADVNKGMSDLEWRLPLPGIFGMEVARVLGGGVVPGSLILVGGDPGVGKSTLLLQIASLLTEGDGKTGYPRVLYVSGEESIEQIKSRAERMRITTPNIYLWASTEIREIVEKSRSMSPRVLIVDSIQTVYLEGVSGSAGSLMQVKECTSALLRFAKHTNIPIFLIGHVTKTGDIAGPRVLEHIVDAVLYVEGERNSSYRLLRSVKNRFGSTDELGVFEMSQSGLQAVMNPSEIFLSSNHCDSDVLAGLAVAVVVDGSRTFLVEIQALCVTGSSERKQVNGIPLGRADMIISVLMKQAGLKLRDFSIYLNVVSGFKLTETAGDLAIAAAICSSFLEFPISHDTAFIGEIGLGGELRVVPRMDKRIIAVGKLGFKTCIVPKLALKGLLIQDMGMKILGCRNLKEVIGAIYHSTHETAPLNKRKEDEEDVDYGQTFNKRKEDDKDVDYGQTFNKRKEDEDVDYGQTFNKRKDDEDEDVNFDRDFNKKDGIWDF